MTNPLITELNCETGVSIDRPMSDAEYQDFQALQTEKFNLQNQQNEALVAKETAQTKLAALGFTTNDLKALGL